MCRALRAHNCFKIRGVRDGHLPDRRRKRICFKLNGEFIQKTVSDDDHKNAKITVEKSPRNVLRSDGTNLGCDYLSENVREEVGQSKCSNIKKQTEAMFSSVLVKG